MILSKPWPYLVLAALFAAPLSIGAQVESTPIPLPAKPDLSPMSYLVGTWTCTNTSSRRPRPFTTTTTFAMDPDGYWIDQTSTSQGVPWFPHPTTTNDKITYDTQMKRWVDVSYGTLGGYGYSVSAPGSTPARIVWHDMSGTTGDPTVATQNDIVQTQESPTHVVQKSDFKETSGRTVSFVTDCKKQ